jgi:RHS repeat-associated protein
LTFLSTFTTGINSRNYTSTPTTIAPTPNTTKPATFGQSPTPTNATTNISHYHYTYDPGNRLKLTTGTDGNKAVDYSNDNQIKTVTTSTGTNEAYQFDTLGNRSTWSTDPLDSRRLLNDGTYKYRYDDEGNLSAKTELATGKITTYQWDYRNRLVSVTSDSHTIEYLYDAQDKRVGKKIDGIKIERYIYDGEDIALVVTVQGTLIERYLYGDSTDNVLAVERDGTISWSLADRQGSIVDLVDEGGTVLNHFVYDSFGSRTAATGVEFRYGYTGRELDRETGLYYYRARYYEPTTGRFISEDPMGFGAGDTNLYRYVGNNATNFTDPTGMTISGWGEDLLNGVDSLVAGFANVVTFGLTNKIREVLPNGAGKIAKLNQEGLLYNIGSGLGIAATLALNPSGAGAAVFKGFAAGYEGVGTVYGALESTGNILKGEGSAWDALNFIPAAGFALHNRKATGSALGQAIDRVDNKLFGGNSQRLEMAAEGAGGGIYLPQVTEIGGLASDFRPVMSQSRNTAPLTQIQEQEITAYAKKLGATDEMIHVSNNMNTAYGNMFGQEILYVGTDVLPLPNLPRSGATANSRLSPKSVIAHELVGHRRAEQTGHAFDRMVENISHVNIALDEAQASIRAARFAPDLTSTERYTLLRDGINRLKSQNMKIKDVRHQLWIDEA